ncbi:hypothetical protein VTO42DRAFT_130 [Malbranchea cinnamomea]
MPPTLAYIRRPVKEQATQAFQDYWAQNAPKRYTDLEIPLQKAPVEMKLSRFTLESYAKLHCLCGHRKTPEHFFYCRLVRRAATRRRQPAYNLREILATARDAQEFNSWLNETRFYKEICPMHRLTVTTGQMLQPNSNPPSPPTPPSIPPSAPTCPSFREFITEFDQVLLEAGSHSAPEGTKKNWLRDALSFELARAMVGLPEPTGIRGVSSFPLPCSRTDGQPRGSNASQLLKDPCSRPERACFELRSAPG